jgi:integrase/recombinase XerD
MRPGFASLLDAYLADLRRRRCAPSTCEHARRVLPRFFDHLRDRGVHDPRRVDDSHIRGFARHLASLKGQASRPLAPGTQAHYLAVVKAFFGFLERERVLLFDPAAEVPLPVRRALPRALSQAQARRLVSVPGGTAKAQRDRALLELLYGTGLRMSECVRLDLADVDLAGGRLLVRDGKGRKDRMVPFAGRASQALAVYLARSRPALGRRNTNPALFLARTGKRLSAASLRLVVRTWGQRVRVRSSCHVLRHSYATHLLQGGASIREIQKLLGHRRLTTTALYTRVDVQGLAAMLRRCHPRERRTCAERAGV